MSLVVFKVFPSVNAAYQSKSETIATSISSVYNKLNGLEPAVAAKLVNEYLGLSQSGITVRRMGGL